MRPRLKNQLMRVTNYMLYLTFCGLIGTGALLTWRLLPGSKGGGGNQVLGMTRHEWGDIHFWIAVAAVISVIIHLFLNWAWLKKIATQSKSWRLLFGFGLGFLIILGLCLLPVEKRSGQNERGHEQHGHAK